MFRNKDNQSDHVATISLSITIITIYVALVAHASATSFKAGYLSYFGIDIRNVDYWPSIADFMNEPILVIAAIFTSLLLYLVVALLFNGIHWVLQTIATKKEWKKLVDFIDEKPFGKGIVVVSLVVLLLIFSFKIPLYDSHGRGIEFAKQQKTFTVLATEDSDKQALIYQYGGLGLVKTYNASTKTFDKTYETIDMANKKFEAIQLISE